MNVADKIRGKMKEQRVTVKKMARCFGVSERTWSNWLSDPETQISIGRLRVIAELLHTSPTELIGG